MASLGRHRVTGGRWVSPRTPLSAPGALNYRASPCHNWKYNKNKCFSCFSMCQGWSPADHWRSLRGPGETLGDPGGLQEAPRDIPGTLGYVSGAPCGRPGALKGPPRDAQGIPGTPWGPPGPSRGLLGGGETLWGLSVSRSVGHCGQLHMINIGITPACKTKIFWLAR